MYYAVHFRLIAIGKLTVDFLLVIIELFSLGAFVLSQFTHMTDRQTDIQTDGRTDAHLKTAARLHSCNLQAAAPDKN